MYVGNRQVCREQRRQLDLMDTFERCQTVEMGGRILVCDACGARVVKYHPCNKRGCYKCGPINQRRWQAKTNRHVLPTGHFHQIFKVPTNIFYPIWKRDEKKFIGMMFRSVQRAYKEEMKHTGLTPGIIMVFQSHGEQLCVQLHIHCIVSMGGISERGDWIPIKKLNEKRLEENYRRFFYEELSKRYKGFPWNRVRPVILEAEQEKTTVYTTYHKKDAEAIIAYLSKSLCGLIVAPEDLKYNKDKNIAYMHNRTKGTVSQLDGAEFTRRCMEHIPMKGEVLVRHYGLYSNRYKEVKERIRERVFHEEIEEEKEEGEVCKECGNPLRFVEEFTRDHLPLEIRLLMNKGSPPKHGELLAA